MTDENLQNYMITQQLIIESMQRIAIALELMIPQKAPDYQFALKDFNSFNWSSIGANVVSSDRDGATAIAWKNNTYLRRSPSNKFGAAIWFSRCTGKDERGENEYERLVTFKAMPSVEPLPARVASHFGSK